ncbi:rRNA maturation RNase YbeY [Candidatus Avelusimicrobium aviculae]|uniref:rRNA maturation RNase YbeY n=1 Tax=Candidatus Avelusimicrobium aviculae TaxID=3416206 RepID=UPI003D0F1047
MNVNIFYQTDVPKHLRRTGLIKKAVLSALGEYRKEKAEVNIVFVDKKEILRINKAYLNHHYVTDVISFNQPRPPFTHGEPWAFGDVFVCYQVAREQAKNFGHTFLQEMMMYAVHGTLHLTGMDDHTPPERAEMDRQAEKIIARALAQ